MTGRQPEDRRNNRKRMDDRAERLAAALKANLKRRKAQARGRAAPGHEAPAAPPEEAPRGRDERQNR